MANHVLSDLREGASLARTAGDAETVFVDLYPRLVRCARMLAPAGVDAEDLVQDALVNALARHPGLKGVDHPQAYLMRAISRTAWRQSLRLRLRAFSASLDSPAAAVAGVNVDLFVALRTLPMRQRECLFWRFVEDYSVEKTAAVMGCSNGTVKSQTSKALSRLAETHYLSEVGA
jgi:DNA-directed RNA polymerase specialized sigma24 family protein